MFHYLYCIENIVSGKVYVGKHSTHDLDDGYMGSGVAINEAIKTEGLENFRRHILKFFESSEEAFVFEQHLIDDEVVYDDNTYNLVTGGGNGWDAINANEELRKEKNHRAGLISMTKNWENPDFRLRHSIRASKNAKRLHAEGKMHVPDWTGHRHSKETKLAIGRANSIHQTGEGNSQSGTIWIHHPEQKLSKKIPKEDLEIWISDGWIRGRKMKW